MPPHPDAIADCVLQAFARLPQKFKPRTLPKGRREWVPLAGIVVCKEDVKTRSDSSNGTQTWQDGECSQGKRKDQGEHRGLTCVALATGMRCLPASKVKEACGNVLHDWHAEVLAIRGFNRWILEECLELARSRPPQTLSPSAERQPQEGEKGEWVERTPALHHPFRLRPNVRIHMYTSSAPCGDASMELLMSAQPSAEPWKHPAPSAKPDDMLGRGHFDRLGEVRRKPSRPDAPVTLSKSCSDKLALKQITGLLAGVVSGVVAPGGVYVGELVLPEGEVVRESVERCFGREGRMKGCVGMEERAGYGFRPFEVKGTERRFEYERVEGAVGSNLSALWMPRRQEVLIGGVLQGRKVGDERGRSCASRREMWALSEEVMEAVGRVGGKGASYGEAKREMGGVREEAKREARQRALKGWRQNEGDEDWGLQR